VRLRTKEIRIINTQESRNNGDVLLQRRSPEMRIHSMSTCKELMEILVSDINSDAQANGRPNRVTASNPALKSEHVLGVNSKLGHFPFVGGECDKVLGDVTFSICPLEEPGLSTVCIGGCLGRGESLGSNKEEGSLWVRTAESFCHVCAINVGDKVESLLAVSVELESFRDHDWAATKPLA
jgi:hypothetical protein